MNKPQNIQSQSPSKFLNEVRYNTFQKLGDCYIPGNKILPSFSQSGCAEHVDRIFNYIPNINRFGFQVLLIIFSITPSLMGYFLIALEWSRYIPHFLGGGFFRSIRIHLRTIFYSLYYSGLRGKNSTAPNLLETIGYKVQVNTSDIDQTRQPDCK